VGNRKAPARIQLIRQIARDGAEVQVVRKRSACRSALAATLAVAAACSSAPPRSAEQRASDQAAAERIYAALNADPTYFYRHVDVRVDEGVADLSGYVWSTDAIYRARDIARQMSGGRRVVTSHLELERAGRTDGRTR
jgi:osmotically-inducible protein OsmY